MRPINFHQTITLENERVLLRPLQAEDFEHLKEFAINEPTLWQYSLMPADGLENMRRYIDSALLERERETSYPFIVFDKQTQKYVGSTRFYDYQSKHNTIQLGYTWYGKAYQGTGLNKQCKFLMLQFAFETLELDRVEFRADNNNARSITAMKSIGCIIEGVLRSNCASPTSRRDSIVLSILKSEWNRDAKNQLEEKLR